MAARATAKDMLVFGGIAAAIGLYFTLVGLGLLPAPGKANAPGWVVVACGLVFLLGGLAVVAQGAAGANEKGELPADAPVWTRLLQQGAVLVVVGCLAAVGTWVALFGAADKFSMKVSGLGKFDVVAILPRVAFGIGALITWLYFIALLKRTLRSMFGRAGIHGYPGNVPSDPKPQ